jgi:protein SCO1/2
MRKAHAMQSTSSTGRHAGRCCAALRIGLAAVSVALASGPAQPAAQWPGGNDYQRSVHQYAIPDVALVDAQAKPVRLRELLAGDDAVMLNFVFTTCSAICPVMVKVFSDVPERLDAATAKRLRMVSISIDPDNDTPAALRAYARNFGADKRWTFLTGRQQDIKTVLMAFESFRGDKMNHEPLTLIRSAASQSWVRIDGFANPDELVLEYKRALTK